MSTDDLRTLLDAMQARCDGSMNAYYYSFEETGIAPIDRVLSKVARAGKGSHHTDMWRDDEYGPSHEQRIQEAANESADEVRRLLAAVEAVLKLHRRVGIYDKCDCTDEQKQAGHEDIYEVGLTCNRLYDICDECCRDDVYQREGCADYHEHTIDGGYCPTVTAIRAALVGDDDD